MANAAFAPELRAALVRVMAWAAIRPRGAVDPAAKLEV